MKFAAYVLAKDSDQKQILIKPTIPQKKIWDRVHKYEILEIVTNPIKKDKIRKKIFSLIEFLWKNEIYEIFGASVQDAMRKAIEKRKQYHGEEKAKEMYRYNIYLQCGFTTETVALVPDGEGRFVRMFCEVARSLSNESGVTYQEMLDFYQELEALAATHVDECLFQKWISVGEK